MVIRRGILTIDGTDPSGSMQVLAPDVTWNPDGYERAVNAQLSKIALQPVGALLLQTIRRQVWIVPNPRPHAAAAAGALGDTPAEASRGFRAGHQVRNPRTGEPFPGFGQGTGNGAGATVLYTPGEWIDGSRLRGKRVGPGSSADQVLFHELFHAMRVTNGLLDTRPLRGELAEYDNFAEFFCIMVSNIYISQSTGGALRSNHRANGPALTTPMSFTWNENHQRLIRILCADQPVFTRAIALQRAFFNPFRDHYIGTGEITHRDIRVHHQAQQ